MGGSLKISQSNGCFSIRYHLCMMIFLDSVLRGDILSRMVVLNFGLKMLQPFVVSGLSV